MHSGPGYEALRRGRFSSSKARYFLTLVTGDRRPGLTATAIASTLRREIDALNADASWELHGAVIMPDHIHLFITLGDRLKLGQCVGRLKSKTRVMLAAAQLRWHGNYFDHRLRPDDSAETLLSYLFLNPYRAQLLPTTEHYQWFWLGANESKWFRASPADQLPEIEWLQ